MTQQAQPMDWFERITGFRENGYEETRSQLTMEGEELVSLVTGRRYGAGRLELRTLQSLRDRVNPAPGGSVRTTVRCLAGDARALHSAPEFAGSLFQVASQFNLLEIGVAQRYSRGRGDALRARPDPGPRLRHRGRRGDDF